MLGKITHPGLKESSGIWHNRRPREMINGFVLQNELMKIMQSNATVMLDDELELELHVFNDVRGGCVDDNSNDFFDEESGLKSIIITKGKCLLKAIVFGKSHFLHYSAESQSDKQKTGNTWSNRKKNQGSSIDYSVSSYEHQLKIPSTETHSLEDLKAIAAKDKSWRFILWTRPYNSTKYKVFMNLNPNSRRICSIAFGSGPITVTNSLTNQYVSWPTRKSRAEIRIDVDHEVNAVALKSVCDLCMPQNGAGCQECPKPRYIAYNTIQAGETVIEAFTNLLLKEVAYHDRTFIAHIGGRYDLHFILSSIYHKCLDRLSIIAQGRNILSTTVDISNIPSSSKNRGANRQEVAHVEHLLKNKSMAEVDASRTQRTIGFNKIRFIDSYNFLNMSLESMPKASGFDEDVKGFFP
ncbi:unnamed protein product [Caenorhabditis angaria]|uniref:DNA-directed DNA polymerase n=1 Tax=Caenorhabditis angaria TaxID=860376 RepID=A0A9P1J4I5_9PELO|nr:unnamed protein product [Caenorhabditis angaria]